MTKSIKDLYMYILGAVIVLGVFTIIGMLVWVVIKHPETPLLPVLTMAVGALIAAFGSVVQYFYGSSKGSSDKTAILAKAEPIKEG